MVAPIAWELDEEIACLIGDQLHWLIAQMGLRAVPASGHPEISRILYLRRKYWWPFMSQDIQRVVVLCSE